MLHEYAGFFHIGMVERNEHNAIIQHGTMTMIRRDLLGHHGWAEWCITEDAELGLRLLAAGSAAAYTERSYGRGLMPDSFAAYKGQRQRWAYGAMRILRRHGRRLAGASALDAGQRYHLLAGWLPWMADAVAVAVAAIAWTALSTVFPTRFLLPPVEPVAAMVVLFGLNTAKTLVLYPLRVRCGAKDTALAMLAGLALSHTIGKAGCSLRGGRSCARRRPSACPPPYADWPWPARRPWCC